MFMEPEKLSKKSLKYIIKNLEKEYGDTRPVDTDVYEKDDIRDSIDSLLKMFGVYIEEHYEYGFYWLLYLNNRHKKDNEGLEIPKKHRLAFYIDVDVTKYSTESYRNVTYTYSTRNSFNQDMIYSDNEFDFFSGEYIDDNIYDSETGEWNLVSYEYDINESVKSENTLSESKEEELKKLVKLRREIDMKIKKLIN